MTAPSSPRPPLFGRAPWREARRIARALRTETVGGALLLAATLAALAVANSPWHGAYTALSETVVGYAPWHLDLTVAHWAADGLLAIFFFMVGVELKHEFVAGELRNPRTAALPVVAAACGVAVPALFYLTVVTVAGHDELRSGWAIPTATDIAFALGVLAVIGQHLPSALRTFLLTLAVTDDLLAIVIIALFLGDSVHLPQLSVSLLTVGAFALAVRHRRTAHPLLLVPLALGAWALMHASGVHATIAGVLLGMTLPIESHGAEASTAVPPRGDAPRRSVAEQAERWIRPLSAGFAVPVFAFFAAGVRVVGENPAAVLTHPVALGIAAGLVLGKVVGVFGGTWLLSRFTKAELDAGLAWRDVLGMSMLCGIGFTVSLLVGELSFPGSPEIQDRVRLAILLSSAVAAVLGALVLRGRNRAYRAIAEAEERDINRNGIPDVYEEGQTADQAHTAIRQAQGDIPR